MIKFTHVHNHISTHGTPPLPPYPPSPSTSSRLPPSPPSLHPPPTTPIPSPQLSPSRPRTDGLLTSSPSLVHPLPFSVCTTNEGEERRDGHTHTHTVTRVLVYFGLLGCGVPRPPNQHTSLPRWVGVGSSFSLRGRCRDARWMLGGGLCARAVYSTCCAVRRTKRGRRRGDGSGEGGSTGCVVLRVRYCVYLCVEDPVLGMADGGWYFPRECSGGYGESGLGLLYTDTRTRIQPDTRTRTRPNHQRPPYQRKYKVPQGRQRECDQVTVLIY